MFRLNVLSCLIAGITASTTGYAADLKSDLDDNNVQTLVVTGSHIPDTQVAQAIVISQEQITLQNSGTAADLLRNNSGIDVTQPGGPGGITELFIRGAESNFTVVTINGVRVNDTTNSRGGSFDLSSINPDDIERVEILKGPLSATYGSDALAGALNIITKQPTADEKISVREEVGSDGYQRSYISANGGNDDVAANIRVARLDSGEPVKGSTALTKSLGSNLLWTPGENNVIDASVNFIDRDRSSYPTGGGGEIYAPLDNLETSNSKDTQAQVGWNNKTTDKLSLDVRTSYFKRKEKIDTPMIPDGIYSGAPAMKSDSTLERERVAAFGVYDISASTSVAVGSDYETEKGRSDSVIDLGFPLPGGFNLERTNLGAFVEGSYKTPDGFELFASSRIDKPEDHSSENSNKISVAYPLLGKDSNLGLRWGEAFKLPSFYAVGDSLVGNPDLRSETSKTTEVFYNQAFLDNFFHVNASLYKSHYEQLIDFDFATFKLVNRDNVDVNGAEVEFVVNPLSGLEMGVHLSHNDYDLAGAALNGRPETSGGFYAEWINNDWSSRLHWTYVGERASTSTPTGEVTLPSYQRVDFVVVKSFASKISVTLNIDNLFDKEYQEEIGFPSPGRALRVGISANF